MTQTINTRLGLPLLLVVTAGAPANAQVAGSFDRLALLVDAGDRATVTDDTGRERSGRIIGLSPSALALLTDGARHDLRETQAETTMAGAAHAREGSSLDVLVGGGMFLTDDDAARTGEVGVNKWLTPGFGFGVRHSLQSGWAFAQLTSVTLNFRAQTSDRVQLLFGWTPFISSIEEHDGWEAGIVGPLVDLFIRYELPDRRFDVQAGVNIFARDGAWIHPMVLGVFSF